MKFILLILFFYSPTLLAEDGLILKLTISEESQPQDITADFTVDKTSYNRTILISFNEEFSFNLDGYYKVKIKTSTSDIQNVDLTFTLNDIINNTPLFIDTKSVNFDVGERKKIDFSKDNTNYSVYLDTSYGALPN